MDSEKAKYKLYLKIDSLEKEIKDVKITIDEIEIKYKKIEDFKNGVISFFIACIICILFFFM